jgi:hypothetical protein
MPPASETRLTLLLSRLADWIPICDFEQALNDYFAGPRSNTEIADYRTKKGSLKKLRDEITPVLSHVKFLGTQGEIRFELGDGVPDCWLRDSSTSEPRGLEVTTAQSREQYYLGQELNQKGMGRGFIGLPDDAPLSAFSKNLSRQRIMYSTESALKATSDGIKLCLKKKAKPKYAGFDLLIEAPLHNLPNERWSLILEELRSAAAEMPFRQIHVIGSRDPKLFGFRIK